MQRPNTMPLCCSQETVWVDNVPGKEYCFCRTCKHEVPENGKGCGSCVTARWPKHLRDSIADSAQDSVDALHYALAVQPTLTPRKGFSGISHLHVGGNSVPATPPSPTVPICDPVTQVYAVASIFGHCKNTVHGQHMVFPVRGAGQCTMCNCALPAGLFGTVHP